MNNNLNLFIQIVNHLEWLTTFDEYGSCRSKGIATRAELAEELNETGIVPKKGSWTTHSLECFLSRMQKQYGCAHLRAQCDTRFMNAQNWEVMSGTHHTEVVEQHQPKPDWGYGKITMCEDLTQKQFKTVNNDLWRPHERNEMWRDYKNKKNLHKEDILRRNRILFT